MKTAIKIIKKFKKTAFVILSLFVYLVMGVCSSIFGGQNPVIAYAESDETNYAETYVMDDLKGMTIDGKVFDIKDYSFNVFESTNLLQFVEYCYSFDYDRNVNYNFYVYIHNPKGLTFVDSSLNAISMRVGERSDSFTKYRLKLLSVCKEANYERLFYKFAVDMSAAQKEAILKTVKSAERVYEVGEIELLQAGQANATAYKVGGTYTYSGYARGYGADETAKSTLKVTRAASETLSLNVEAAFYRPDGNNGKNEFTQDTLHSVYFAVPKTLEAKYGNMTAVHAEWLEAKYKPGLITGNKTAYSAIEKQLGQATADKTRSDWSYMYLGGAELLLGTEWLFDYSYNCNTDKFTTVSDGEYATRMGDGYDLNPLYMLIYSGNVDDSADTYFVSSEKVKDKLTAQTWYSGELLKNTYMLDAFESVADEFTEVNYSTEDNFDMKSIDISSATWWEKLFKDWDRVTETFDGIPAVYAVQDSDVTSEYVDSKNLYISEYDYTDFKDYYDEHKKENTVYMFRYRVSDYMAQEATLISNDIIGLSKVDNNAYFFQGEADLDFDIIDVTFTGDEFITVMPVVMSPQDFFQAGTPPMDTNSDKKGCLEGLEWWHWLLIGLVLLFVLGVIFPPIWKGIKLVVIVVTFPVWFPIWGIIKLVQLFRGDL